MARLLYTPVLLLPLFTQPRRRYPKASLSIGLLKRSRFRVSFASLFGQFHNLLSLKYTCQALPSSSFRVSDTVRRGLSSYPTVPSLSRFKDGLIKFPRWLTRTSRYAPTPKENNSATTEPSMPALPPDKNTGPLSSPCTSPWAPLPTPKTASWEKSHPKWRPIASHSLLVRT